MAVNESRSMVMELETGATEGSYKSPIINRGGAISSESLEQKRTLAPDPYDIQDTPVVARRLPTGRWGKLMNSRA